MQRRLVQSFTYILKWGQGTCTLTKHTRRWTYSALRHFFQLFSKCTISLNIWIGCSVFQIQKLLQTRNEYLWEAGLLPTHSANNINFSLKGLLLSLIVFPPCNMYIHLFISTGSLQLAFCDKHLYIPFVICTLQHTIWNNHFKTYRWKHTQSEI